MKTLELMKHFTNIGNTLFARGTEQLRINCDEYCKKHFPNCDEVFRNSFYITMESYQSFYFEFDDLATSFDDLGISLELEPDEEYTATIISNDPDFIQFVADNIHSIIDNA